VNPYVIGYDPLNEPMPSWNGLSDLIYNVFPKNYDKNTLTPLYEKLFKTFVQNDEKSIMFFEPGQFPDMIGIKLGNLYLN